VKQRKKLNSEKLKKGEEGKINTKKKRTKIITEIKDNKNEK
jgi:hypothetical protein